MQPVDYCPIFQNVLCQGISSGGFFLIPHEAFNNPIKVFSEVGYIQCLGLA